MIRTLLISFWIAGLTLASVYFGIEMRRSQPTPETAPAVLAARSIMLKAITVPVIADGALKGYVLTSIAVAVSPDVLKTVPQPAEPLLVDAAFATIYGEERIDFKHFEKQDLASLSKKILRNINARAGATLAADVYIQELHYLNKIDEKEGSLFHH